MATNQYLPFATSDNANVLTADEYNNLSARGNGFQSGVASSTQVNTPIRQATVIASAVAQYIADISNTNMLDDGNVSSVVSALKNTINNSSSDKLPLTGGTITGKTTISYSAPEIDLMAGSNSYVMRIFSASTSAGFAFTGTDNSVKTRIRFTRSTETINIENSKLTIDGASVLTTSGGTVSGNTNFTGKLQQAGNDVITTANVSSYQGLGYGQTWQDVTSSRSTGVTYTNTTGKPIFISTTLNLGNSSGIAYLKVDNVEVARISSSSQYVQLKPMSAIVPNGSSYTIESSTSVLSWAELR